MKIKSGGVLLSHAVTHAVSSAAKGLTAEFGMGSGVALFRRNIKLRLISLFQAFQDLLDNLRMQDTTGMERKDNSFAGFQINSVSA
jgi:hypothetical protein